MTSGVNVRLFAGTNAKLELYLGWARFNGERINKEDIVNAAVEQYVTTNAPASLLEQIEQRADAAGDKRTAQKAGK